jgi:hypothetical protein
MLISLRISGIMPSIYRMKVMPFHTLYRIRASTVGLNTIQRHDSMFDGNRWFSQEKKSGFMSSIKDAITSRQERKASEEFAAQCERMASKDTWTIQDFQNDLGKSTSSWRSMIPGVSDLNETKVAKETNKVALAIIEILGPNLSLEGVMEMSRENKLKVAIQSEKSVSEINLFMTQCQNVDILHKILRRRKLEGRPIPTDQRVIQNLVQSEGLQAMSGSQRQTLKAQMLKRGTKGFRRRA